jgi:hypothetical protein
MEERSQTVMNVLRIAKTMDMLGKNLNLEQLNQLLQAFKSDYGLCVVCLERIITNLKTNTDKGVII